VKQNQTSYQKRLLTDVLSKAKSTAILPPSSRTLTDSPVKKKSKDTIAPVVESS
jgi:hypothetical protein